MRDTTGPVQLLPGDSLTLADIHRLLPHVTRIDGDRLTLRRAFRFRRAPVPPAKPKPPIVPFEERGFR